MSKATRRAPSDLLDVTAWASDMLGMPDTWTAIQFDAAVSLFGVWIDGKLDETDYTDPKHPRPKYSLDDLLNNNGINSLKALSMRKGVIIRMK